MSLNELGSHRRGCNSRAAAKGLELAVGNYVILVNFKIHLHYIAALSVAYYAYAVGILNFTHVSRIGEMIHYLFTVFHFSFLLILIIFYNVFPERTHIAKLLHYRSNVLDDVINILVGSISAD